MNNKIKINEQDNEQMKRRIMKYFEEERDEDLGELGSQLVLDFFIEKLAPFVYNKGVEDAHLYMRDQLDDLFALQISKRNL